MHLENVPFEQQLAELDRAADLVAAEVNRFGPMSSAAAVYAVRVRHCESDWLLRMGAIHAVSTGRVRRDLGTWQLEPVG